MKLIVRKRLGIQTSLTKIRQLSQLTGARHALKVDLNTAQQLLNQAFQDYKEA